MCCPSLTKNPTIKAKGYVSLKRAKDRSKKLYPSYIKEY